MDVHPYYVPQGLRPHPCVRWGSDGHKVEVSIPSGQRLDA